jgi:DNA-binding response OmpR family regulator
MVKILIVEDDIDLCDTYKDILEAEGHNVDVRYTGSDGVDYLMSLLNKPDIVILDMHLPGDSGVMVLSLIHHLPRLKNTRVVVASGLHDLAQWAVKQWGADAFLKKPVPLQALVKTVQELSPKPKAFSE